VNQQERIGLNKEIWKEDDQCPDDICVVYDERTVVGISRS